MHRLIIVENSVVQEQMIVQENSELQVMERIQEQIVETIEVVPQERFQQCASAPTMHVVTREQFPRRKVRFATEDDIQIIADSSRRAEVSEITRAVTEIRNDIAQLERDGFDIDTKLSSI